MSIWTSATSPATRRVTAPSPAARSWTSGAASRALVVVADQEVRAEADEPPAGEQEHQVRALDEEQHREDEQRHVGEVAPLLVLAVHVADRVGDDQEADPGNDEHHEGAERVDEDGEADLEVAGAQPRPEGRDLFPLLLGPAGEGEEADERRQKRDANRCGCQIAGGAARQRRSAGSDPES